MEKIEVLKLGLIRRMTIPKYYGASKIATNEVQNPGVMSRMTTPTYHDAALFPEHQVQKPGLVPACATAMATLAPQ